MTQRLLVSWPQVSLVQSAIGDGVERSTADFAELLQVLRSRAKESKEGAKKVLELMMSSR